MRCLVLIGCLAACGSGDTPTTGDCGGNGPCPAGFVCDPVTLRCIAAGTAGADAPLPDAPPAPAPDARPPDARSPDAHPPDAHAPDAGAADAPVADAAPAGTAKLSVTPSSHDFGGITLGASTQSFGFTVKNAGSVASGPIAAAVDDPNFQTSGGTCTDASLAPGASCLAKVRFVPTGAAGPKAGTLTIAATPGGSVPVAVSGTALTPGAVVVGPRSASFGDVAVGAQSGDAPFTLSNGGQSKTGTLSIVLSDATNFTIASNDCPTALDAGAMCTVVVRFTPATVGLKDATLTASDPSGAAVATLDGTGTATLTVAVGGTGSGSVSSDPGGIDACTTTCTATFRVPTVRLSVSAGTLSDFSGFTGAGCGGSPCDVAMTGPQMVMATFTLTPASLSMSPTSHDFGSAMNDTTTSTFDFTVTNSGGAASSTMATFLTSTEFAVTANSCNGQTLAGFGGTCTVTLEYAPMLPQFSDYNSQSESGTLTVSATSGGSPSATLSGTATCQAQYGGPCTGAAQCCAMIPCIGGTTFSCHYP